MIILAGRQLFGNDTERSTHPKSYSMNRIVCFILLPVLLLAGLTSCQDPGDDFGSNRREAVKQFVQYLKENNEQGVYQMTYHGDMPDNITNEELRRRDVRRAAELISRYGLPAQHLWRYTVDTNNKLAPYSVTIPLLKKSNTEQAGIYIAFPPEEVSDKISHFIIITPEVTPAEKGRPV